MRTPSPDPREILIVDDTQANLLVLSQMLSDQGYKVRAATSGRRALASVEANPPHIILLDIKMPGMTGYEVCQRLKADPQTHDIPIIFISALDEVHDKVKAFTVGGVDYVTKPFQFEEVLARVETHLTLRELQIQLQRANRRFEQELALAGKIQRSLLPGETPQIPGWQLAATLKPARETSGDFYDFISLPNGRWAWLVADVVDKGAGAAMVMALTRTLIRTYASRHATQPERLLQTVNRRALADIDESLFVTLFYAILDPASGTLTYANAGHHPPYLFHAENPTQFQALGRTGIPLGLFPDRTWEQASVQMEAGDTLIAYTDGIPDAQNEGQAFFGEERFLNCAQSQVGADAEDFLAGILACVNEFSGEAPQHDDIALLVLTRE
jgi:sigma-B regulation protein RsbU (phosphoserine phosphatase)